jgi:hypothetical protein
MLVFMTNMYTGNGPDGMPTSPYRVPPAGSGGPGDRPRRSRAKQVGAALLVCAAVGGGTFAVVEAVSGPASSGVSDASLAASTTQAAALRSALTTPAKGHRWAIGRIRALGGMSGQFTYDTKSGPRTLAFERGTVSSVTSSNVVVRAKDGTSETWELSGTSVVREDGTREPTSTLAQGQTVFAAGPISDGAHDARLIVIRKTS